MNEEQKKLYKEKYYQEKQKGVKFWPDIIYKDVVTTFPLFIVLVIMAIWVGVVQEPKADPSDSTYIPRPEWYFLFSSFSDMMTSSLQDRSGIVVTACCRPGQQAQCT